MQDPTPYLFIAKIVSVTLIGAATLGWLALIVRKRLGMGRMAPLHDRQWFIDTFKGGAKIIRRCPWLLIVPLAGVIVQFCESLFWTSLYLGRNPATARRLSLKEPEQLLTFLKALVRDIPGVFLETAAEIDDLMLYALRSPIALGVFLLLVTVIVLRPRQHRIDNSGTKAPKLLGVLSGLIGAVFVVIPILQVLVFKNDAYFSWIYSAVILTFLLALPFAYALLIPAMDAAYGESVLPFTAGLSKMEQYFRPLFGYVLLSSAVIQVALLPSYLHLFLDPYHAPDPDALWFLILKGVPMCLLLSMMSFIPVIVVVRQESFVSAFHHCIELWARNAKNAAVFILIGALLPLLPVMLERRIHRLFSSHVGWEAKTCQLVLSLSSVAIGVFVISSMVVFYKKILESEKTMPEEGE